MLTKLLDRLTGKRPLSRLRDCLANYPPYSAPFTGNHLSFSDDQARQNLHYLLENKSDRIELLAGLVSEWNIPLHELMDNANPEKLASSLHRWAGENWQDCKNPELAALSLTQQRKHWELSDRSGPDIIYSVIKDTALVLGEYIIKRKPSYRWGVDLDPVNIQDGMFTVRRCVLQAPQARFPGNMDTRDMEHIVADLFWEKRNYSDYQNYGYENQWLRTIEIALEEEHPLQ